MGRAARWLAVAVALLIGACASMGEQRRLEQFERTARAYDKAIRWSDFQAAYSLTRPDPTRPPDFARLKGIQVTSYEAVGALPSAGGMEVRQTVAIEFMRINDMRVRRIVDEQVWVYSEAEKRWQLTTGLPDFR
jgi:hypothetical protein